MIKIDLVWILLLAALVVCAAACVVVSIISMKKNDSNESFLRTFPYEVADKKNSLAKVYRPFLYVYAGLCFGPLFDIVPNIGKFNGMEALGIIIACVFGLAGLMNAAIHLFEAKFPKVHTIVATVSFMLTFLASCLVCLFSILVYKSQSSLGEGRITSIVLAILAGIFAIAILAITLNPKLKDWARLEQVSAEDGSVTYKRPKIFWLAFSEWLVMGIGVISELVFFLSFVRV